MLVSEFLAGAGLALVSAALGFVAGGLGQWRDKRARRKSVATLLLVELRWQELLLRKLAGHAEAASSTVRTLTDVYDRFAHDVVLFEPETARRLLEFRGLIRDMEVSRETISNLSIIPDEKGHHYFRVKATFAAQLLPELRTLLEKEGGVVPTESPYQTVRYPELPPLQPPAFPGKGEITPWSG